MICYTVISNNYDHLKDPKIVSEGWEYICLSDQPIESDVWQYRHLECHNREPKIMAHEYFDGLTLYVDGSISIYGDLNEFIAEVPGFMTAWAHPHRNCLFSEMDAVVKLKNIDSMEAHKQANQYLLDGMPKNWGLAGCGVLLRDLSDPIVGDLCEQWWQQYEEGVKRDQISYPYIFWKNGYRMDLFDQGVFNKYFVWHKHK